MPNFLSFLAKKRFPSKENLSKITGRPMSFYGVTFSILVISTLVVLYILLIKVNDLFLITIPAKGGTLTEGVIGAPKFINPILAKTETDTGIVSLVYSGLMKETGIADVVPDLAEKYEVSPDGAIYEFTLKKNIKFSDGTPLTSSDVSFTYSKLANHIFNNEESVYWQNIVIETPSVEVISFTLPNPDPEFLSHMTLGILPSHIWKDVVDEEFENTNLNMTPIGTGTFKYRSVAYSDGIPKEIVLVRNNKTGLNLPILDRLKIMFFANEEKLSEAMLSGKIDATFFISPKYTKDFEKNGFSIQNISTNRSVSLYHLKKEKYFSNQKFVSTISNYVDKNSIIDKVENSYGTLSNLSANEVTSLEQTLQSFEEMKYILKDGILQKDSTPVIFGIATENSEDMLLVVKELATQLENLGISVVPKAYDPGTFQESINNKYYEIFQVVDGEIPIPEEYEKIVLLYVKEIPLIKKNRINIPDLYYMKNSTSRYLNVTNWYVKTDKVWKFLKK